MQSPIPEREKKPKIIHSLWVFLIATATTGPFALPLIWRNPHYSTKTKVLVSAVVILFTGILIWIYVVVMAELSQFLQEPPL